MGLQTTMSDTNTFTISSVVDVLPIVITGDPEKVLSYLKKCFEELVPSDHGIEVVVL
jgi:hypothetical protein